MEALNSGFGSLGVSLDDAQRGALDFFRGPDFETSMLDSVTVGFKPVHIDDNGPYTFNLSTQGNQFMQLHSSNLYLKLQVVTAAGTALPAAANGKVCLVSDIVNSFCEHVDISIDGSRSSDLANMHHNVKAYVETMLSYGRDAESTHLETSLFYTDDSANSETYSDSTKFTANAALLNGSSTVEAMGPLHIDLFKTDRVFPPGMTLSVTLHRATDDFLIKTNYAAGSGYRIKILDMRLYVRFITLTEKATMRLLSSLTTKPVVLPFTKSVIKRHATNSRISEITIPAFVQGPLPRQIVILLTDHDAHTSKAKNPYNFKPFKLSEAWLSVNGRQVPAEPLRATWGTPTGPMLMYRHFIDNVGLEHLNTGNLVTFDKFKNDSFMLAWDLTPDGCEGAHHHLGGALSGNIDCELRFTANLATPIIITGILVYDVALVIQPSKEFIVAKLP